jgi:histidine triad (HIT) family protein
LPLRRDGCVFCDIVHEGTYVAKTKGAIAIKDINPQAQTHVLVIPEKHVESFREIGSFSGAETKRMLEFIADVAGQVGLTDYQVVVNVGRSAGQTVFHLHWHIMGDTKSHLPLTPTTAVTEL